jgi:hypothetical protein
MSPSMTALTAAVVSNRLLSVGAVRLRKLYIVTPFVTAGSLSTSTACLLLVPE